MRRCIVCIRNERELYGGGVFAEASETHFIGHPGRLAFSYNVGNISCVERTCGNIYHELQLGVSPDFPRESNPLFVDDFRGLSASLRLIQAKNLHGGGRFGGTGAPFLNSNGHIVGLYSFTHYEEDYAIQVAEIQKALMSFSASVVLLLSISSSGRFMTLLLHHVSWSSCKPDFLPIAMTCWKFRTHLFNIAEGVMSHLAVISIYCAVGVSFPREFIFVVAGNDRLLHFIPQSLVTHIVLLDSLDQGISTCPDPNQSKPSLDS
uniref:Uncharacterized protein n=1 Tax=Chenopodium quinoa TaxID=63459 RepID=A0A803NA91_CHEQI